MRYALKRATLLARYYVSTSNTISVLSYRYSTKFHLTKAQTVNSVVLQCRTLSIQPPMKESLVYESQMNSVVKKVKIFSLSTSFAAIVFQPLIIYKHYAMLGDPLTQMAVAISGFFSLGMIMTPLLLHFICKRHVLRLYFDEPTQTFTAETYSLFLRPQFCSFVADEVIDLATAEKKSILDFGTMKVRDKVLLMDIIEKEFTNQKAYDILVMKCAAGERLRRLSESKKRKHATIIRNAGQPPVITTHDYHNKATPMKKKIDP